MIFFILDCIICLTQTRQKSLSKCKCKYNIHKDCYKEFLENSMFLCPICRKQRIEKIYTHNDLDYIVKVFFTVYLIFIILIYSILIYINLTVFNKFILKKIFFFH